MVVDLSGGSKFKFHLILIAGIVLSRQFDYSNRSYTNFDGAPPDGRITSLISYFVLLAFLRMYFLIHTQKYCRYLVIIGNRISHTFCVVFCPLPPASQIILFYVI